MTTLENAVYIDAPPDRVWGTLARLDALHLYDPAVARSVADPADATGVGAARRCDLKEGGWFRERVTQWEPHRALAFELCECTLPLRRLEHRYTLTPRGNGTFVEQRMDYALKFGPLGALLDALVVRRKWDAGVKSFFLGLKKHVEGSHLA